MCAALLAGERVAGCGGSAHRRSLDLIRAGQPTPKQVSDHGTERPWADPSHTPRSHPPCSRAAHTRSKKSSAPPAAIKFCIARGSSLVQAASISEPSTLKFFCLEQGGFLGCMFEAGTGPCGLRFLKLLHNRSILHPQAPRYGISRSRHRSLSCCSLTSTKSIHRGRVGRSGVGLGGANSSNGEQV